MKKLIIGHLALLSMVLIVSWFGLMAFGCISSLFNPTPEFYCSIYCKIMMSVFALSVFYVVGRFIYKAITLFNTKQDKAISA